MTANPNLLQLIPILDDSALIGRKSPRQQLFDLFDAADELTANVSLWERDDSEAATALVLWASDHRRTFARYTGEFPAIEVKTRRGRTICVYLAVR